MFDALVYGEDGYVAGVGKSSMAEQCLQASQNLVATTAVDPYFFYVIGGGKCA